MTKKYREHSDTIIDNLKAHPLEIPIYVDAAFEEYKECKDIRVLSRAVEHVEKSYGIVDYRKTLVEDLRNNPDEAELYLVTSLNEFKECRDIRVLSMAIEDVINSQKPKAN